MRALYFGIACCSYSIMTYIILSNKLPILNQVLIIILCGFIGGLYSVFALEYRQ